MRTSRGETRRQKCTGRNALGMIEPGGGGELGQRMQGGAVEIVDALELVGDHQRAAAGRILGGNAGRARSVWQLSDWMQPIENMKARAALHQSAPSASARAMSKAVAILPAAPMRMRSRTPMPTSALCTKLNPSRIGMPRWSMNSSGAAPVPPSVPSTTTKSGQMPVSSIALQIARNSQGWPTQSLNPTGLPPHARRICSINCSSPIGVEKAV